MWNPGPELSAFTILLGMSLTVMMAASDDEEDDR